MFLYFKLILTKSFFSFGSHDLFRLQRRHVRFDKEIILIIHVRKNPVSYQKVHIMLETNDYL